MTTIQQSLNSGFDMLLQHGGHKLVTSAGQTVTAIVQDAPEVVDPTDTLQAQTPVYARVACKLGAVTAPRTVTGFTDTAGKTFTVLRYVQDVFGIKDEWLCEKQRT